MIITAERKYCFRLWVVNAQGHDITPSFTRKLCFEEILDKRANFCSLIFVIADWQSYARNNFLSLVCIHRVRYVNFCTSFLILRLVLDSICDWPFSYLLVETKSFSNFALRNDWKSTGTKFLPRKATNLKRPRSIWKNMSLLIDAICKQIKETRSLDTYLVLTTYCLRFGLWKNRGAMFNVTTLNFLREIFFLKPKEIKISFKFYEKRLRDI